MVAARADGKPLFCQTTPTTATVTDPNAAPDSGTAAVLFSREGVVVGVTDVDWNRIALKGSGPNGSVLLKAESGDRLIFGGELRPEVSTLRVSLGDGPPQPVTVADRTFAFFVPLFAPLGVQTRPVPLVVHAVAFDANGVQLYERSWNR